MTGLWPHTNGCVTNGIPLPKATATSPAPRRLRLPDRLLRQVAPRRRAVPAARIRRVGEHRGPLRGLRPTRPHQRSTYDRFLRDHGTSLTSRRPVQPRVRRPSAARVGKAPLPRARGDRLSAAPPGRAVRSLRQLPGTAPALRRPAQRPVPARRDGAAAELRDTAGRDEPLAYRVKSVRPHAAPGGGHGPHDRSRLAPADRQLLGEHHPHRRRHRRHLEDARRARDWRTRRSWSTPRTTASCSALTRCIRRK